MTVTKSASCFNPQQIYRLADLVTVTKSAGRNIPSRFTDWQIWWVTKSAGRNTLSRFTDWQIWWQSLILPAEIFPQQINWLADLVTVTKSTSRNIPPTPWQIYWLADLVTVTKYVSRSTPADLLTGRIGDGHLTCWQKSPQQIFWIADLVTVTQSAVRNTPQQIYWLVDLVIVTKSAGRNPWVFRQVLSNFFS